MIDLVFMVVNLVVTPFWLLMIFFPGWKWTLKIIRSPLIILPPALIYAALVLPQAGALLGALANPDLNTLAASLANPTGFTIAWAHLLAFDLLAGRWAYLDSREKRVHPVLMGVVLFFTFMLGPVGFLLYLLVLGIRAYFLRQIEKKR
jgi:hypothetical protein